MNEDIQYDQVYYKLPNRRVLITYIPEEKSFDFQFKKLKEEGQINEVNNSTARITVNGRIVMTQMSLSEEAAKCVCHGIAELLKRNNNGIQRK